MGVFDDIVKTAEEADRPVLTKYQAKIQPILDEIDQIKPKYQAASAELEEWHTWKRDAWDPEVKMTKSERAVRDAYQAQQERIAALESATGTDMTFEEMLPLMTQKGVAFKPDVEAIVEAKTKPLMEKVAPKEYVDQKYNDLSAGFGHIYTKTYNLGRRHEKEFGEELDLAPVLKYMSENKINDPELAYNQMYQTKRTEIAAKKQTELDEKHKTELEAARKAGEEAGAKKVAMGLNGKIPTDQGGSNLGHLQRRQAESKAPKEGEPDIPAKTKLGDGVLALKGFEELQKTREAGAA